MAKYHINPKTGRPNLCDPKVTGVCKYAEDGKNPEHYDSKDEAKIAYEKQGNKEFGATATMKKPKTKNNPDPILLEPTQLKLRHESYNYYDIETEYDAYYCSTDDCGEDGDYCRDGVYEGLRVVGWENNSNLETFFKDQLGIRRSNKTPEDLKAVLAKYDSDQVAQDFEAYGEGGYYGEEIAINVPEYIKKEIKDYYYSQPNATDEAGILPYVRGKGTATAGLTPVNAIKAQLAEENSKILKKLENANAVQVGRVDLSKLKKRSISQTKEAERDPRSPDAVRGSGTNESIAGVVFKNSNDEYELLDGYHRTSFLSHNNKKSGKFIILANFQSLDFADQYYDRSWNRD